MKENKLEYVKQAFENYYSKVCDLEQRITALHYAMAPIKNQSYYDKKINEDFDLLHSVLYGKLNDAYRTLFMFSVVSCDRKLMLRAKELAFKHYLTENSVIMQYLGFEGSHSVDLEKKFRAELDWLKKNENS